MQRRRGLSAGKRVWCAAVLSWWFARTAPAQETSAPAAPATLAPCQLPGLSTPARCGVIEVLENPERPKGRKLPIHVAVVPATSGKALPDPIVVLMGGPGEATISAAADVATHFGALHRDRDVLLVDQRGTGKSAALNCPLHAPDNPAANLKHVFPPSAVARCVRRLRAQADLTQYGFARFAHDLEQVRRALGYGALNLIGGSYGTRAEQVYARLYPASVRTIYFGSIVPIDLAMPLPMAQAAQAAIERTFEKCAADEACKKAFPNVRTEFRELSARLAGKSVSVVWEGKKVVLEGGRIAEWFRSRLYRPEGATQLPWLIHRAYEGDFSPIAQGIVEGAKAADADLSFGLFFAITCNEDVAFVNARDVAKATAGTFLGDYRLRQQQAACKFFPRAALPAGYREQVRSDLPAMFVSGDFDAGTPLWFTEHAAPGFSQRVEIVMRGHGHTTWNECLSGLYQRFVASGSPRGIDPNACPAAAWPAFRIN